MLNVVEVSGDVKQFTTQLPMFGGGNGKPSEARLHLGHYQRLVAVADAARSGNELLVKLALKHLDEHGSGA